MESHRNESPLILRSSYGLNNHILLTQRRIAEGGPYVQEHKRILRALMRDAASMVDLRHFAPRHWMKRSRLTDVVPSQEIPDYEPSQEEARIKQLEDTDTSIYDSNDLKNYNTVLRSYATRDISQPCPGYVYWFYNGVRVSDAVKFRTYPLNDHVKDWTKKHGKGGKLWVEKGVAPIPNMLASVISVQPWNESQQHMLFAEVQSSIGHPILFDFLDDTGSEMPSFFPQDVVILGVGFGSENPHWGQPELIHTAAGAVYRRTIVVSMRWVDPKGSALEGYHTERAVVLPEYYAGACRLSGMSLRTTLFTATAPDGNGILLVAEKKNGVVSRLPVV